jgi:hypothetical protein
MLFFKILWVIDALISLIFLYFFVIGVQDGTVSAGNIGLWLIILSIFAGILFGSYWLRGHNYAMLANLVLLFPAVPAILYGIIILTGIFGHQRWN